MTATNQQRLGKPRWAIADQLRGAINEDDHFPDATKMVTGQLPATIKESLTVQNTGERER